MSDKNIRWGVWEKTMNLRFDGGQLMQEHVRVGRKKRGAMQQHMLFHQSKWVKVK